MSPQSAALLALLSLSGIAGCTQFPALDQTVSPELAAADYPDLVPLGPLLAQANADRIDPVTTQATLEARLSRLHARAARLRGSVLSGRERQRLSEGLR